MSEQQPAGTPAGWYPHPTMANTQGYWDGTGWTDQVAPAAPARSDATNAAAKVFLLLVAAVVVLGVVVVLANLVT